MALGAVQCRKGLSEASFDELCGTGAKRRAAVIAWRWPSGFERPACGGASHSGISTRGLFRCSTCRRQTSPIAGTISAATKVELRVWFRAMHHLTQGRQGISGIEPARRLGVTQTTAWTTKHKLAQVMMERDADQPLPSRCMDVSSPMTPVPAANARAASAGAARPAGRPSSRRSRRRRRASRSA